MATELLTILRHAFHTSSVAISTHSCRD